MAARQGDLEAFSDLMRKHERTVITIAWRLLGRLEDAQDASQEVFLRLHRSLDIIDERRPLGAWLYRVTVNVCHDLRRRRRAEISLQDLPDSRHPETSADAAPDARLSLAEQARIAERGLEELSPKERAALVLRDLQGLSTGEVARALGSTVQTVRSQICRARLKMRRFRAQALEGRD